MQQNACIGSVSWRIHSSTHRPEFEHSKRHSCTTGKRIKFPSSFAWYFLASLKHVATVKIKRNVKFANYAKYGPNIR